MHNLKRAGNKYDFLNRTTLNFLYGMDDPKKIQVFVLQSSVFFTIHRRIPLSWQSWI